MENKIFLRTRVEIVQHLSTKQRAAGDDVETLRSWELGKIDTAAAIKQLMIHNEMTKRVSGISELAFHEFARKLGYIRSNG
ncbi:MAG: hypothetical protein IKE93_09055 [Erysipelotrichaceae bacterium]|nr:hypothetical protein [Erysipelotrichaceae bacterium]